MRWRGPWNGADKSLGKSWVSCLLLFTGINDVELGSRGVRLRGDRDEVIREDICSSGASKSICGSKLG